jgi:hypothetical protein
MNGAERLASVLIVMLESSSLGGGATAEHHSAVRPESQLLLCFMAVIELCIVWLAGHVACTE